MTGEGVAALIGNDRSELHIRQVIMEHYGIDDLTSEEIAKIQKAGEGRALASVIGPMLSKRSAIGWIYGGHTGEDLFLYAYGPHKPSGLIENTQIAKTTAKAFGFDLAAVDRELFVLADDAFKTLGANVEIDASNPEKLQLVVTKGWKRLVLPVNTNIIQFGKDFYQIPGITVFIPQSQKAYVPKAAVDLAMSVGF